MLVALLNLTVPSRVYLVVLVGIVAVLERVVDRLAGEAKVVVLHDGNHVVDVYFSCTAPVRGFEKLVLGKSFMFAVEALMRICGICHAAHGIAAVEAFEDAIGIMPPLNGRRLREAIGLINRVQSHLVHLVMLLPDVTGEKSRQLMRRVLSLLETINMVMARIGGAPTHPPNIAVGGVAKPPTEAALNESLRSLCELVKGLRSIVEEVEASSSSVVDVLRKHSMPSLTLLATHLYYGDKYSLDLSKVKTVRYPEYRGEVPKGFTTTSLVALYNGSPACVGPYARMKLFRGGKGGSLYSLQEARMEEILLAVDRVIELLSSLNPSAPYRTTVTLLRAGEGVGVYEAPRGLLIHYARLDEEGRVRWYRIIVPTMFNIPVMEQCARGLPLEAVETAIRLFDPCIPCATHLVRVSSA